jgi:hypothetical protein
VQEHRARPAASWRHTNRRARSPARRRRHAPVPRSGFAVVG